MYIDAGRVAGMNMNFALYSFGFFLDAVQRAGLSAIELWAGAPHLFAEDVTNMDAVKMARDIRRRGLHAVCLTPEALVYPYNIASSNRKMRERAVAFEKRNIEIASVMEIPLMLVLSGRGLYDEDRAEAMKRSQDALCDLAGYAERFGVVLLLEALQYEESNLVTDINSLKEMLKSIASPCMKTMIDTVQALDAGDTIRRYFEEFGENVKHIHLTEGNPVGHLTWGEGSMPLVDLLKEIDEAGYQGYLSLEAADHFTDPAEALERGVKTVGEAIGGLQGLGQRI